MKKTMKLFLVTGLLLVTMGCALTTPAPTSSNLQSIPFANAQANSQAEEAVPETRRGEENGSDAIAAEAAEPDGSQSAGCQELAEKDIVFNAGFTEAWMFLGFRDPNNPRDHYTELTDAIIETGGMKKETNAADVSVCGAKGIALFLRKADTEGITYDVGALKSLLREKGLNMDSEDPATWAKE